MLQAVLERAAIPEQKRRATFLIVDEAATYFDSNIDDFLTETRKYKCGCVFAHQFLDQATSQLRSSLAANTAIKFAGAVSMSDARALAPDMRTTADFVLSQPRLHFAAHVRHTTPGAVSIPVDAGRLEREPLMDADAYRRLRAIIGAKVSIPNDVQSETVTAQTTGEPVEEPPSKDSPKSQDSPPLTPEDPSAASEDW